MLFCFSQLLEFPRRRFSLSVDYEVSMTDPTRPRPLRWIWLLVPCWAVVLLSLPFPIAESSTFNHDSAYLARLAENLRAGHGYVNDAHWLVFLDPPSLPMPYHNANPLYPTLLALTPCDDVLTAARLVSVVGSLLTLASLLVLVARVTDAVLPRVFVPLAGAIFPPVFVDAMMVLPDALALGLLLCSAAALWRVQSAGWAILAGMFFGAAWLTRSSVVLAGPACVVYLLTTHGWRSGGVRLLLWATAAMLTISPWLWHTAVVWGDPWRSDAAYYLWQDYHAKAFDGSVERYWHSTTPPPPLRQLAQQEPTALARFYLTQLFRMPRTLLAHWTEGNYPLAGLLVVLTVWSIWAGLRRGVVSRKEWLTGLVYLGTVLVALAPRAGSMEIRYVAPLSVLLAVLLASGTYLAWMQVRQAGWINRTTAGLALGLGLLFWLGIVPWQVVRFAGQLGQANREQAAYLHAVRQAIARTGADPVVVGHWPYFYAWLSKAPALSIPDGDDDLLRQYMKRYQARWLLLTRDELAFWRPHWMGGHWPDWLESPVELDDALLWKSKDR
jgi:hypothetical protein